MHYIEFSEAVKGWPGERVRILAPAYRGLGEIDGLLLPPGKASTNVLTDHLIAGYIVTSHV